MSKKDFTFSLIVPLSLKNRFDVKSLNSGIKSISFHVDFEDNLCHIFSRNNDFTCFLDSVRDFDFAFIPSDVLKEFGFVYSVGGIGSGLQKENEKELVSEKFPKRSRCKKS